MPWARAADLHRAYLKDLPRTRPWRCCGEILADVVEAADYATFLQRRSFTDAADPQEEQRYLYLLADFEDPTLFTRTLTSP